MKLGTQQGALLEGEDGLWLDNVTGITYRVDFKSQEMFAIETTGDGIRLHEYRTRNVISASRDSRVSETLCFGQWYTTGEAPCEIAERERAAELANLPPCDADDLRAVAELLAVPKVSRCWTKGRASWQDVVTPPDAAKRPLYPARTQGKP